MSYEDLIGQLPIPYMSGFALTQPQVDALARLTLSEEQITASGGTHRAIIARMRAEGVRSTLVPFWKDDVRYYLYVTSVIPSFDGHNPRETVSKPILADFRKRFGNGPNGELKELHSTCMLWPDCFAIPDWLYPRMVEKARYMAEKAQKARAAAERRKPADII
ncbi:hypothetical protein BDZ89DRAFT_1131709 [Hymenopellis radicata]|nr:hypothetical protein BDZ89DRAFT_1131709 [Hymenopellis radicata]